MKYEVQFILNSAVRWSSAASVQTSLLVHTGDFCVAGPHAGWSIKNVALVGNVVCMGGDRGGRNTSVDQSPNHTYPPSGWHSLSMLSGWWGHAGAPELSNPLESGSVLVANVGSNGRWRVLANQGGSNESAGKKRTVPSVLWLAAVCSMASWLIMIGRRVPTPQRCPHSRHGPLKMSTTQIYLTYPPPLALIPSPNLTADRPNWQIAESI